MAKKETIRILDILNHDDIRDELENLIAYPSRTLRKLHQPVKALEALTPLSSCEEAEAAGIDHWCSDDPSHNSRLIADALILARRTYQLAEALITGSIRI